MIIDRIAQIDDTVRREIQTHRKVYHTHIIAFKEAFLLPEHLAIVMEYASGTPRTLWVVCARQGLTTPRAPPPSGGDMFNYVTTRRYPDGVSGRLKEAEARWYFQQLILAVDYLHKMVRWRVTLCACSNHSIHHCIRHVRMNEVVSRVRTGCGITRHQARELFAGTQPEKPSRVSG